MPNSRNLRHLSVCCVNTAAARPCPNHVPLSDELETLLTYGSGTSIHLQSYYAEDGKFRLDILTGVTMAMAPNRGCPG